MKVLITLFAMLLGMNLSAQSINHLPFTSVAAIGSDKIDLTLAQQQKLEITDITVTEIETPLVYSDLGDKGTIDDIALQIDKLIALGKKVWAIFEKNRPVLNADFGSAISVVPQVTGVADPSTTFAMMSGWQQPRAKSFRVIYHNALGMDVITFDYTVIFQYGGQYEGVGSYLTGVNVFAGNITVNWGFSFSATSSLVAISNLGSINNPVAGATIRINYQTDTVVRSISASQVFHLTGLGQITQL